MTENNKKELKIRPDMADTPNWHRPGTRPISSYEALLPTGSLTKKLEDALLCAKDGGIGELGWITENVRVQALALYDNLHNIINLSPDDTRVPELAKRTLNQIYVEANEDDFIRFLVLAEVGFKELLKLYEEMGMVTPGDEEVSTEESIADIPYEAKASIEGITRFCNGIKYIVSGWPDIPARQARGRVLVGQTIKDQLKEIGSSRGIMELSKRTGINRSTLNLWAVGNITYAFPKSLNKLAEAIPGMAMDYSVEGKADLITDDPDHPQLPENRNKLRAMVAASPTLQAMEADLIDLTRMSSVDIKQIYIDDTTKEAVAKLDAKRDHLFEENAQQDAAVEAGMVKLHHHSQLNAENQWNWNSSIFTATPPGVEAKGAYAIYMDTDMFKPAYKIGDVITISSRATIFDDATVVAIVRSKSEDEAENRVTYVLGTYKIIKNDENGKPKVVVIETTQKGKNKVYGFYKGFKIIPELVKNRKGNDTPWEEVIDRNVKLLKCHKLVNVRLG